MTPPERLSSPRGGPTNRLGDSSGSQTPAAKTPPLLTANQTRYHERMARQRQGETLSWFVLLVVLGGVAYNALLAFLNAHGLYVGLPLVVLTEFAIFSAAALAILTYGARRTDGAAALLIGFFLADAMTVSLVGRGVFVDMARNAAIIGLFLMVGARINENTLTKCFLLAALLVSGVLLIEIFSVQTYASLFEPARYFEQTRGIAPSEFDELGLFGNALGFDERFTILRLIDHRASSLFLEQVSLANFAIVLVLFLICKWEECPARTKVFFIALIALILVTTNSRSALAITMIAPIVYWLAPRADRYATLLIMPAVLMVALTIAMTSPPTKADVLEGRVGLTIRHLGEIDLASLFGANALKAETFADSGYIYVIYGSSVLGMLALWLFISLIAAGTSKSLNRCSMFIGLYIFSSLTVSGTSVFSIKTAALLWLLVGHLREKDSSAPQPVPGPQALDPSLARLKAAQG